MRVAYRHGEEVKKPKLPKPPSRKQVVAELAAHLIEKWTARDRAAAMKKYGITHLPEEYD